MRQLGGTFERRITMKKRKTVRKSVACVTCFAMIATLFTVVALAAGPYYGTAPCPCGAAAYWMDPGVTRTQMRHTVNNLTCIYYRCVGGQGMVCPTCGLLLREVAVDYEVEHNHPVDVQPGQEIPDVES